ncbi:MAG: gliding motility-associated C-terminal domain-containing protein [Bacteroidia bacterium]|nr:gliding motility-associated C-terminal domain-containing protein [Bacteroidota bacterium]MBP9081763.1 gliding motility-associated C-terminal domain-containing protein [Bacteroidia bacterium]MBK7389431.1 gliding motility-associated C-terminal domain-containing protein [Bacteroidota bacterium]MBK7970461.1 gliding motility-associated C-terminal domain-containing protein [Bacteroidota bacterium]MBK8876504.1 gliding motility-associated C-terminal domain-containing protein [Bacteroidota bacterium]
MGNFTKTVCLVFLITACTAMAVSAQNVQNSRRYRVVAYKNGNATVSSTSNTTEVVPYMSIYIPNSFTPNGDGLNDTFGAYGEAIKDFRMQVFNRWGQMIFESNNVEYRWDGTHEGTQVPQGSYVYRVVAKGITGKQTTKDGTVNIVY